MSLLLQLPATKKLIKEQGFSNEHLGNDTIAYSAEVNASLTCLSTVEAWDESTPRQRLKSYAEIPEKSDVKTQYVWKAQWPLESRHHMVPTPNHLIYLVT